MADFEPTVIRSGRSTAVEHDIDLGLRSYMLQVYNYMALGLAMTGAIAFAVSSSPALLNVIFGTPLKWVAMFAPLGLVMLLSFRIEKMSFAAAQATFWGYAALNGVAFATIFLAFTGTEIARVFLITSIMFGGMSLWGYTTKRDLSGMGQFMMMGLIGLIVAMVVNIFMQSSALQWAISMIGVVVFTGLTAWDTQQIKEMYAESDGRETAGKKAIMGALRLYLDFINLFMMMLQLLRGGSSE